MTSRSRLFLFCIALTTLQFVTVSRALERSQFCRSPQSGKIGRRGIIKCDVPSGSVGVYWFDESNDRDPIIRFDENIKTGPGYRSNQYDVSPNGSLIIRKISGEHDGHFKLVVIDKDYSDFEEEVKFNVVSEPSTTVPDYDKESTANFSRYQYGYIGTTATINWKIESGFEGVYWFEGVNERDPIVRYERGVKLGRLYGVEYDICDNGSLVIKNVTLKYHERVFKLIVIDANYETLEEEVQFFVIGLQTAEPSVATSTSTKTTTTTTRSATLSSPPQGSQLSQTHQQSQSTKPSANSHTSKATQYPQTTRFSVSAEDDKKIFTDGEVVKTSHPLGSPTQGEFRIPTDEEGSNGSHGSFNCQYLQVVLSLSSVILLM